MHHDLKTWPEYFQAVLDHDKTFEIRSEKDRTFAVGDTLLLEEWYPPTLTYSGRKLTARVSYLVRGSSDWTISLGTVVLGLTNVERVARAYEHGAGK